LQYLRARYYSPALKRFTSQDTWGGMSSNPTTLNRFAYAGGNPVRYTDPSGHCFTGIIIDTIICGAILGATIYGAWDVFVTQGVGLGGRNQGNFGAVNWSQAGAEAGRGAQLGAIAGGIAGGCWLLCTATNTLIAAEFAAEFVPAVQPLFTIGTAALVADATLNGNPETAATLQAMIAMGGFGA
jgi:hypothetical protein